MPAASPAPRYVIVGNEWYVRIALTRSIADCPPSISARMSWASSHLAIGIGLGCDGYFVWIQLDGDRLYT
jgi:hypothetical protein